MSELDIKSSCTSGQDFVGDFRCKVDELVKQDVEEVYIGNEGSVMFLPKKPTKGKKSVLLLSHELSRTGAPIVALDMTKVLMKNGYFVTWISPLDGPLKDELVEMGVTVIVMPKLWFLQTLYSETYNFAKKLDLDEFVMSFDIVIANTLVLYNLVRRYFNKDKRIVWWIHEGSMTYDILGAKIPKIVSQNIEVFCVGNYARRQLIAGGYKYNPSLLNYGVNDVGYKAKNVTNAKVVFMVSGTIGDRKGQLILLEAIKGLSAYEMEQIEVIFVGDICEGDPNGKNIHRQISKFADAHKNVSLLKTMERKKLYKLYEKVDVLVVPSVDDPMPVVATENFMLGHICICSDATGTADYIKDGKNGFVFRSGDVEHLRSKISYIIKHKNELEDIKLEGRKIFEKYFDMSIFEENLMKIVKAS